MKLKVILTGATGMVGEGVLHECLHHNDVEDILIINRKPSGVQHLKLREIIHPDFFNLSPIADQLTGYNACFFLPGSIICWHERAGILQAHVYLNDAYG